MHHREVPLETGNQNHVRVSENKELEKMQDLGEEHLWNSKFGSALVSTGRVVSASVKRCVSISS